MQYGDIKPHEADALELDHVIAYKQSLKFNSQNVSMEVNLKNFSLENYPLYDTLIILRLLQGVYNQLTRLQ